MNYLHFLTKCRHYTHILCLAGPTVSKITWKQALKSLQQDIEIAE